MTELDDLIRAKHDHIMAIDRIEQRIAEINDMGKYKKYKKGLEQKILTEW